MEYIRKIIERIKSTKFQAMVATIIAAVGIYNAVPHTTETTMVLIGACAVAIGKWIEAQGRVDAAAKANGQ